jgi:hypothetical protein
MEYMMAKLNEEKVQPDLLDEVKQIERAIRAKALAKMLTTLKEKAHEILELKEYTNAVLEELGVEEADKKRLIDWINSLDQVKLSKNNKESIRDNASKDVHKERKEAEKKIPDVYSGRLVDYTLAAESSRGLPANNSFVTTTGMPTTIGAGYIGTSYTAPAFNYVAADNSYNFNSGLNSLNVKLK